MSVWFDVPPHAIKKIRAKFKDVAMEINICTCQKIARD